MNLTQKTILALGLVVAGVSFAQTETTSATPAGLLGQSYSEVRFGASDIKGFSKHQYGAGLSANVPLTANLDLGAGYDYGWIRGLGHFNQVSGGATAFTTFNGVKPFVGGAVGYQWASFGGGSDDDQAIWGVTAGVELPLNALTLTPRVVYSDDFRGSTRSSQQLSYEVEGNYWLTRTSAVFAAVGYSDVRRSSFDSWDYTIGARFKF